MPSANDHPAISPLRMMPPLQGACLGARHSSPSGINCKAQRRRSASMARRCPRSHRRHPAGSAPRTPPVELEGRAASAHRCL